MTVEWAGSDSSGVGVSVTLLLPGLWGALGRGSYCTWERLLLYLGGALTVRWALERGSCCNRSSWERSS